MKKVKKVSPMEKMFKASEGLLEQSRANLAFAEKQTDPNVCRGTINGKHEWIPNDFYRQSFIFGLHFLSVFKFIKTFTRCAACNKIRN